MTVSKLTDAVNVEVGDFLLQRRRVKAIREDERFGLLVLILEGNEEVRVGKSDAVLLDRRSVPD